MCDWLKLLIFSNLLIIHSLGRAVASHSIGGCRPLFFFFLDEFHEREIGIIFFFLLKLLMIPPIVFLNLKQLYSFVMEWVLPSQHNSVVLTCYTKTGSGKELCREELMGSKREKGTEKRKSRFCGCKT